MTSEEARRRFSESPVARLATVDGSGRPHLVPITFVLDGDCVYSAVDTKPKRSTALRRLENVRGNSAVALLVDHYEDDWGALWWVRADGRGRVLDGDDPEARRAALMLGERYPRFEQAGAVLAVDVDRWSGWAASSS